MDRIENGMYATNGSSAEAHKFFLYSVAYGGGEKCLKHIYLALNVMKLTYVIQAYKSMFLLKKLVLKKQIFCMQAYTKVFQFITAYGGKMFKAYFNVFIVH